MLPVLIKSTIPLSPTSNLSASTISVLPAPVSPDKIVRPLENLMSALSIMAIFSTFNSLSNLKAFSNSLLLFNNNLTTN